MVDRIDKLTPEQEAQMKPWADKWIDIGLSTETIDVAEFAVHAKGCYESANLTWPGRVFYTGGPVTMSVAGPVISFFLDYFQSKHSIAPTDVSDELISESIKLLEAGMGNDDINEDIRQMCRHLISGVLGADKVEEIFVHSFRKEVEQAIKSNWNMSLGGNQYWSYWSAWTSFFREVCDLELEDGLWDKAKAYEGAQINSWAWWPHSEFVLVCDHPLAIHRIQVAESGWNSHVLHNETGPSVEFRDGYKIWSINGTRVTEKIVLYPESLTPEDVWAETNSEVRRVMIDRMGWDRFVSEANLVFIASAEDPGNPGYNVDLYKVPEQVYEEEVNVCLVHNASPERDGHRRRFGLTVPANLTDPIEAIAWTFGMSGSEYAEMKRAT